MSSQAVSLVISVTMAIYQPMSFSCASIDNKSVTVKVLDEALLSILNLDLLGGGRAKPA